MPAQVLWALCRATRVRPAVRIPPSLHAAAVRFGVLTAEDAISIAERAHHAEAIAGMAAEIPDSAIPRAPAAARSFQDPRNVIVGAAPLLPRLSTTEHDRLLAELLDRSRELDSEVEFGSGTVREAADLLSTRGSGGGGHGRSRIV